MENMELLQAMRQMMEEVVSPIYERMDKMQEELSSVKEEVASVKEEVASVKEEVASVKEEVASVKEEVASVKEEVASVKEEVASVKEEVASIEEEVASVKSLATKTQIAMENDVVPKIKLLFEGHTILHSRLAQLNEMERILREVQSDVLLLKNIVASHSGDIRMLKRRRIGN